MLIFGLGGSNIVAQDAFHKLIRIGINCVTAEDFHIQLMLASQSSERFTALIFSHTGTNIDTLAIAQELHDRGCRIIVVTTSARSSLARMGTIVLEVAVGNTSYVSEAFSSRIAQQVIIDVLYVTVLERLGPHGLGNLDAMRTVIAKRRL